MKSVAQSFGVWVFSHSAKSSCGCMFVLLLVGIQTKPSLLHDKYKRPSRTPNNLQMSEKKAYNYFWKQEGIFDS